MDKCAAYHQEQSRYQELATAIGRMGSMGATRAALASALGLSKVTIAEKVRKMRRAGYRVRSKKVRQGRRGPLALAYVLE